MRRLIDADALIPMMKYATTDSEIGVFPIKIGFDAITEVINNAPTIDTEPHWTPCSERLPEDDRSKVVTLANGNAEVGYYSNGDWWCVGDKFTLENPTVIAWMPLPKPYEVKE